MESITEELYGDISECIASHVNECSGNDECKPVFIAQCLYSENYRDA